MQALALSQVVPSILWRDGPGFLVSRFLRSFQVSFPAPPEFAFSNHTFSF